MFAVNASYVHTMFLSRYELYVNALRFFSATLYYQCDWVRDQNINI